MHVLLLGASKNIGYFAALRLLKQGTTATFLLRSPSVFDKDAQIQSYIKDGKVQLVRGDGLRIDDVRNAWESALRFGQGKIDAVLFTIGGSPSFTFTKGIVMNPPDLCTRALLNTLSTIPASLRAPGAQPRFVVITSMGLTAASRAALPLALKPFYGLVLTAAHADKLGVERVLAHCAGQTWSEEEPNTDVLKQGWKDTPSLLAPGELKHLVVVRPALLTDGVCRGDEVGPEKTGKAPYRALANGNFGDGYRVSRQDTAHFIVHGLLSDWSKWEGSAVTVAY